jgi:cytochrome P450
MLILGVAPELVAPKAVRARRKLHSRLSKFYEEHRDEGDDVSPLVQNRAVIHREFGFTDTELGVSEFFMPWAATTNTPISLVWLFASVFSRRDLVGRIRPEVEAITVVTATSTGRTATTDVNRFDKQCPTLMACYREALRVYNNNTGNRRVLKDTFIQDSDGREYLLKQGTTVQWIAGVAHLDENIWGANAHEFDPDRWIQATAQDEKRRRPAHIPFGGGRNLCPGRNFALAEQLALVSALALGFEVEGVQVPRIMKTPVGNSMRPPSWEGLDRSVRIRRRTGWEDVTWDFTC